MIQISTPAQHCILPELGFSEEKCSPSELNLTQKTGIAGYINDLTAVCGQKKAKSGFFASLLEGTLLEAQLEAAAASANPNTGQEAALTDNLKSAETLLQQIGAGQDNEKTTITKFIDENGQGNVVSGLTWQDLLSPDKIVYGKPGAEEPRFAKTTADKATPVKNFLQEPLPLNKETQQFAVQFAAQQTAGAGDEKQVTQAAFASQANRKENASPANNVLKGGYEAVATAASTAESSDAKAQRSTENQREAAPLSEARNRRGRASIGVFDLRTEQQAVEAVNGKTAAYNAAKPAGAEVTIPVYLKPGTAQANANAVVKTAGESFQNMSFEDALAKELRGNLSLDIVRQAAVVVRNGGEGSIRLTLHPATLGDVKIRLEMAENKITGQIILESRDALRAFERELPVLEKAFRDSGFSETELELLFADDNWNFGSQEQDEERDFLNQVLAAARYEAEAEWTDVHNSAETMVFSAEAGRKPVNMFI